LRSSSPHLQAQLQKAAVLRWKAGHRSAVIIMDSTRRSELRRRLQDATAVQLAALTVLLIGVVIVSTGMGFLNIPAAAVVKIIWNKFTGDPSLIGGISIRIGDEVIDASVRGKLAQLADALMN